MRGGQEGVRGGWDGLRGREGMRGREGGMRGRGKRREGIREGKSYGGRDGITERMYGGCRHKILSRNSGNSVVREIDFTVSVIRQNRNFHFTNMGW